MILLPEQPKGGARWGYEKLSDTQKQDIAARANTRVQKALALQAENPLITDWPARRAVALEVEKKQKA